MLGLTYKPDTSTLRRGAAVELLIDLSAEGATVQLDPAATELPPQLANVTVSKTVDEAVEGADAAVVCTEWPVFKNTPWQSVATAMRKMSTTTIDSCTVNWRRFPISNTAP